MKRQLAAAAAGRFDLRPHPRRVRRTRRGGGDSAPGTYRVYYSAAEDQGASASVDWESYTPPEDQSLIPALFAALLANPDDPGLTCPIPSGVVLRAWQLEGGRLHLNLSEQYGGCPAWSCPWPTAASP